MARAALRDALPLLEEFGDVDALGDDDLADELAAEVFNLSVRAERARGDGQDADDDIEPEVGDDDGDDDDEDDDDNDGDDAGSGKRRRVDALDTLALAAIEKRLENDVHGFSQPVQLRQLEYTAFDPDGWIFDDAAAQIVYNDDRSADERILSMTARESPTTPPPSGGARVCELPAHLEAIVFERWMLRTTPVIVDTNSVATFYIGFLPDLFDLVQRCAGFSFNPKRFAACVARFGGGTVLTFTSGSAVCTGPSGPALSNAKCQEFVLLLNQLRVPATMQKYRLQNVVSNAAVGFPLHLDRIAARFPMNADYKPKRFPGCIFRLGIGQAVAIFFKSGKCILTGLKTRTETRIVWTLLHARVLREFRADVAATHVSERSYRERVVDEASVIRATCASIGDVLTRRAAYDAVAVKRETPLAAAAARTERAAALADAVRAELLDDRKSAIDELLASDRFVDLTTDDDGGLGAHCDGDDAGRDAGAPRVAASDLARMLAVK